METTKEISRSSQKKSKSSSSSESSRESDDTVISVKESESDSKTEESEDKAPTGELNILPEKQTQKAESSGVKPDLQLHLVPAQTLQSRLSPISEGRESLSGTPVTPIDKFNLSPRANKANLHIDVPKRVSVIRPDKSSPALPKTPSNTPDLPRKQVVTTHDPRTTTPKSPTSECSSYGELSPPFSPSEEKKTTVPKPRKANLKGKDSLSNFANVEFSLFHFSLSYACPLLIAPFLFPSNTYSI